MALATRPLGQARLEATLDRLRRRLQQGERGVSLDALVAALVQHQAATAKPALAEPTVDNSIKLCSIDEVIYFQSDERYTRVVTPSESMHVRLPLSEILAGLDQDVFWQLHRGLVMRAPVIAHASRDEFGRITVTLKNGAGSFAVSRAYAWRFKAS